jgi:hypothetical protein
MQSRALLAHLSMILLPLKLNNNFKINLFLEIMAEEKKRSKPLTFAGMLTSFVFIKTQKIWDRFKLTFFPGLTALA